MSKTSTRSYSEKRAAANRLRARRKRVAAMAALVGDPEPGVRLIPVSNGQFCKVDESDYAWLNQWNWTVNKDGYALRVIQGPPRGPRKVVFMHRLILNTRPEKQTDHVNRNRLDNRRCNLREANSHENGGNLWRDNLIKTSRYKGVSWCARRKKWLACGKNGNGKTKNLGRYSTEMEAAIAYNRHAREYFGEFALLNPI